jgi:catechol 2,3-dioxygenase-like lactoylglutathione lyase family enzyme
MKLELVAVPVSNVDRAKAFYTEKIGFHADHDHQVRQDLRFVQLTPPGWRTKAMPSADDLPEIRHEAIPHLLRVFSIPRQIVLQELLLVEDSPYQHRRFESKNRESPP